MPDSSKGFKKVISSEKSSLFQLYEECVLCLLDKEFQIIEGNTFAQCFFREVTDESLQGQKVWALFEKFYYPLPARHFSSSLLNHYPLLAQHHQLSEELGMSWNLCPTNDGQYLFMAQLYQHSIQEVITKELINAKVLAEQGNQSKLDFLANMSHELRNSLNGILGMTQILSMRNLPADTQDYVRDIYQSGNHLLSLVSDMLDFAKLEAGQLAIASEPFNIRKVMGELINQLSKQCEQRNLDLFLDYCDNIPRQVIGDINRLRQIILNLVTNAMKFTLSGHVLVAVELLEKTEDRVLLQFIIEDTGIGIPEDKIDAIFNRYTQVPNQNAETRIKGSGLGLAIVKQLVEKMGGELGVNSQIGHGATFWVNIPFMLQTHQIEMLTWHNRFPNLRLLVVDDNTRRAKVTLKQIFGEKNRAVKSKAALETLRSAAAHKEPYNIVLVDDQTESQYALPYLIEAMKADKQLHNTMVCGLVQEKNRGLYSSQCFYEMLKPLNPSTFANDLAQAWERWRVDLEIKATQREIQQKAIQVLLVEDNVMSQKVARIMLKEFGCSVSVAESGHETLNKIQQEKFDIIFLDIGLPDMNGCDVAKEILSSKNKNQDTPIIALTAHALEEDKKTFLQTGMSDILVKPITFDSARSILLKWTDTKHASENSDALFIKT